jgi:flagellar M-ring protein FliF
MDALKKSYQQFLNLFGSMSGSQRATLLVVPLMVVAAFGFLMFQDNSSSYVALSWGKLFRTEELILAEQTLITAGLTDFRRRGQRIMVPQGEAEQYNAALIDGGGLPNHWAEELEKSLANGGLFQSKDQMQIKRDIVLGKELRKVLRALPDIDEASVTWARSKPARWPNTGSKVTALVSVRPKAGHELSLLRIQSLRYATASMVPDLEASNVTVLNQMTGIAYTAEDGSDPYNSGALQKARDYEREYEQSIRAALSYIPGVLVTVNVDLENLQRSTESKSTIDPKPVIVTELTTTRDTSSSGGGPSGATGVTANTPSRGQQQVQSGSQKTQTSKDSETSTTSVPGITRTYKEFIPGMPESVQVAVSIPRAYARTVATASKEPAADATADDATQPTVTKTEIDQAEIDIKTKVEPQVLKLILQDSQASAVDISFHIPGVPDITPLETSLVDTLGETAGRWGGAAGLAMFALWALWMLNKSMNKMPTADDEAETADASFSISMPKAEEEQAKDEPVNESRRDEIQSVVRDDPELAANVLSKWLRASN